MSSGPTMPKITYPILINSRLLGKPASSEGPTNRLVKIVRNKPIIISVRLFQTLVSIIVTAKLETVYAAAQNVKTSPIYPCVSSKSLSLRARMGLT